MFKRNNINEMHFSIKNIPVIYSVQGEIIQIVFCTGQDMQTVRVIY